jgi:predicted membrane protein
MRNIVKHIIIFFAAVTINFGIVNTSNNLDYVANNYTVMQPRAVKKAQKKQAQKEKNEKKESQKSIKASQKRTYDIQSPEVKKRMKQNQKEIKAREKARKKHNDSQTRTGTRKYK